MTMTRIALSVGLLAAITFILLPRIIEVANEPSIGGKKTSAPGHRREWDCDTDVFPIGPVGPSPETLNVEDKVLCFIHVGKTGGASFRARFTGTAQKVVHHPRSLPSLRTWREIHRDVPHHPADCDYFVAWVREPVDRVVSAYNMVFDPSWAMELGRANKGRYNALMEQRKRLESFGDLNNLTMQLPTNSEALSYWESIEHVGHDTAWYFTYDNTTGKRTKPGKGAHLSALSYLQDEEFVKKLVFVGAKECYNEDVERFATLFNVSRSFMNEHPDVHLRAKHTNAFDSGNLSSEARNILQEYFWHDYCVLQSLSALGLIKCQKLLIHLS